MTGQNDGNSPGDASRRPNTPYKAFLIRCWQEGQDMRFSLESVGRGERRGFDRAADLLAVLKNELEGGIRNEP